MNALKAFVEFLEDKKAEKITVLDLRSTSSIQDFAIIAEVSNPRLLNAIKDYCIEFGESLGYRVHHVEGQNESEWVLIDFDSLVLHLFLRQSRQFYRLEDLWLDKNIEI